MKIILVSGESFGTRSMATYIKTRNVDIFIDPGAALAPRRYGLPPHPIEIERLKSEWKKILCYAEKSDVIIITHYHYDHYNPRQYLEQIYKEKIVLIKDPSENINYSQKRRANVLLKNIENYTKDIRIADDKKFVFGDTIIEFSKPLPHGINDRLGYILEVFVRDSKHNFLYTSDIEGPPLIEQLEYIISRDPMVVYVDGPMTYQLGPRYPEDMLNNALANLLRITDIGNLRVFILDHHIMRDINWLSWVFNIYEVAKNRKIWIGTAAEFMGMKPVLLEAYRKQLYEKELNKVY